MSAGKRFSIAHTTKGRPPRLPFSAIKKDILGARYTLSLVFVGEKRSADLNKTYRGKNRAANVLAFPLARDEGEIYITPARARKDARLFQKGYNDFVGFLFIHACLHLKGMRHGRAMEKEEERFFKKYFRT